MTPKIGFVGVGRMGANMARRLNDCGFNITAIHDIDPAAAAELAADLGATATTTLAEVTAAADVIITVVTDDAAMRGIFAASGDSLLSGAHGRIFINCATVAPATHIAVEAAALKVGAQSLEACMASSINQARDGSLYMMVAGQPQVFAAAQPVLKTLSSQMRYVGLSGQAAKVKALVNMVMNINTAGLAEGLGLAEALGLDVAMVREIFSQTGAASRVLETDGEDMQIRDHACYFSAAHAAKDSGIALDLAKAQDLTLPLAAATKAQFDRMTAAGMGELDKSGIAELTFQGRGLKP